jgi:endonuclease YncB( thermonuclease family)
MMSAQSDPSRALRVWLTWTLLLGLLVVLASGGAWVAAGPRLATVIDGDTIEVDGETVQLYGIDAPELGQLCRRDGLTWHCGRDAAADLQKRIDLGGGQVECQPPPEPGRSGKSVFPERSCKIGSEDLALVMVETGNALAITDGGPGYRDAQAYAKGAGIGVWRGAFDPPWAWRAMQQNDPVAWQAAADCLVKGRIEPDGERVYYVPLDPAYPKIELDPDRGERVFCSDEEASQAGWRRPGLASDR